MTASPLVSILIRTHNRPVELAQAVASVVAQIYRPLELVLVNDGGSAPGSELEQQLIQADIDFVNRTLSPSRGRSSAANAALEAAAGEWLMFLDDDDLILPDHVSRLVELVRQDDQAIGAYADIQCVHFEDGQMIREKDLYNQDYDPLLLVVENFLPIHAVLFHRRAVVAGCRFEPELSLYEDWHFWLQVTQHGPLLHRPQLGGYYRTDCSGVGVPGTDLDFPAELIRFLRAARHVWNDEQLLSLFRSAANLHISQLLVGQLTSERDEKTRTLGQLDGHLQKSQQLIEQLTKERDEKIRETAQLTTTLNSAQAEIDQLMINVHQRDARLRSQGYLLEQKDDEIQQLTRTLGQLDGHLQKSQQLIEQLTKERDEKIRETAQLTTTLNSAQAEIDQLMINVHQRDARLRSQGYLLEQKDDEIQQLSGQLEWIYHSRSWRLTAPLRACRRFFSPDKSEEAAVVRRSRILFGYLRRGDLSGLLRHMKRRRIYRRINAGEQGDPAQSLTGTMRWGVLATPHTLFIAHLVAEQLHHQGWSAEILIVPPDGFPHDYYVVICPQMFDSLPPGEKRIVFQMEQSVSSRWFSAAYLDTLNTSLAVLDYSLDNIAFLAGKGIAYPAVYYLPIGASADYGGAGPPPEKLYDVLFYGDSNSSPRRREMLAALAEKFDVQTGSEIFGSEMQNRIRQARLVINLHYYEDALLEMPRIQECLSLGVPVVSEASRDQDNYPEIVHGVKFFAQGSIPAMLDAVAAMLDNPPSSEAITVAVGSATKRWQFMFGRFLIGQRFVPPAAALDLDAPVATGLQPTVLSLPETIDRRRLFERENKLSCVLFDGIRFKPGWVGCGLSYATLAQNALRQGREILTVMEDDVLTPDDMAEKLQFIHEYLEQNQGRWDVFSGVIADLHQDTRVLAVDQFKGMTLVTIDHMTSMVFNIYSRKALELLTGWNPDNRDNQTNTIDRFLEQQTDVRVVVTLPFLVGHREELYSTLWGFKNIVYLDLIAASEKRLRNMVAQFLQAEQTSGAAE